MRKLALALAVVWLLTVALIAAVAFSGVAHAQSPGQCLSAQEAELVQRVNDYRAANGLSALPASRWLSTTAQWHIWDRVNNPGAVGGVCNPHSWSNNPPPGVTWQGMCYTSDHAQAAQMWGKPRQISANRYAGNGFELAADTGGTQTALNALLQWQGSPAHNAVILQQGAWSGITFGGMGTGISAGYAVLWFGDAFDSDVGMPVCLAELVFSNGFEGS